MKLEKTRVKFLYDLDNQTVFAYFPDLIHHGNTKICYAHIGQHSACSPEYADSCKLAIPGTYDGLKKELEDLGYNLDVISQTNDHL